KIRAAAYARKDHDLVIIARTDAIAPEGFDEAIKRGRAYSEAGADVVFVEAPQNIEQMRIVTSSFDTPVFANMVEGGKTPFLSAPELERLGYDMVVYPLSGLFAATRAIQEVAGHLKKTGTTDGYDAMSTFSEFEKVIGLQNYNELEVRFAVDQA
ncbi:MAG: isocitrate lyase/phosphoenolpyruvate mutase family protein, partial [SAR202 cluster bacterium]|nr:isocitrate lyase/phosphoenolpyruvate mutase family protein [SAR202 cluster bacterium]